MLIVFVCRYVEIAACVSLPLCSVLFAVCVSLAFCSSLYCCFFSDGAIMLSCLLFVCHWHHVITQLMVWRSGSTLTQIIEAT